jgi:hypothetical protein
LMSRVASPNSSPADPTDCHSDYLNIPRSYWQRIPVKINTFALMADLYEFLTIS